MKLSADARQGLAAAIRSRLECTDFTYAELGEMAGVHESQVSRICRGDFRTASYSVMQICKVLGVDESVEGLPGIIAADRQRLEAGVIAVWDRTPQDARRILKFLRQLGELRRTG